MNIKNLTFTEIFLIILLIVVVIYFRNEKLELKSSLNSCSLNLEKSESLLTEKSKIVGEKIWEVLNLSKSYLDTIYDSRSNYKLFVSLDSIICSRCYNYHYNNLKNIKKGLEIVFLINHNQKMIQKTFNSSKIIPRKNLRKKSWLNNSIILVDCNGTIVSADFMDYRNYEISDLFYEGINKFLK